MAFKGLIQTKWCYESVASFNSRNDVVLQWAARGRADEDITQLSLGIPAVPVTAMFIWVEQQKILRAIQSELM